MARLLWDARHDPGVLSLEASPVSRGARGAFDLARFADLVTVVLGREGSEHIVLADGYRHLRLDVTRGSLCHGPAHLRYRLEGFADLEAQILTLRRLLALGRLGRFAGHLHRPERQARRWISTLRAHDGTLEGASQREIALALYGKKAVDADWGRGSDVFRSRIQRLLRVGHRMAAGNYRLLLR